MTPLPLSPQSVHLAQLPASWPFKAVDLAGSCRTMKKPQPSDCCAVDPMRERELILIYGRDAHLLDTRGWVLEQAGYRVLSVSSLSDAQQAAAVEDVRVSILCHSLSRADCEAAGTMAQAIAPQMIVLTLTAGKSAYSEPSMSVFDGPRRLIEEVGKLCARSTLSLVAHSTLP